MHKELLDYLIHLAKLDTNTVSRATKLNLYENINKKKLDITKLKIPPDVAKLVNLYQHKPPVVTLRDRLIEISGMTTKKADYISSHYKDWNDILLSEFNTESLLHLKYPPYTELPNKLATKIATELMAILKKFPNAKIEIAGSLRRKELFSKDIDIVIGYNGRMKDIINFLKSNYPEELYIYAEGESKTSFITRYKGIFYKVDIIKSPINEFYFQLLYLTGSKEHNISMREHAKKMGYLLNQKGLYKNNKPILHPKSEKEIYKFLKISYVSPVNRIRK
jgi:DNA polymerase (family 10)